MIPARITMTSGAGRPKRLKAASSQPQARNFTQPAPQKIAPATQATRVASSSRRTAWAQAATAARTPTPPTLATRTDLPRTAHEGELRRAWQALDPRLLAARGARVGRGKDGRELDGEPGARVLRAAPGAVGGEPRVHVVGPARVERAVRAAQE